MGTQSLMFDLFLGAAVAIIGRLAAKHRVWRLAPDEAVVSATPAPDAVTA
jgi:hypothetical protein